MNKKILFFYLLLSVALGFSAPTYAQNDGHMDNLWLSARIKTKLTKAIDWTSWPAGPFELLKNIKVDTGKNNCYIHLTWDGVDSNSYTWKSFCLNGDAKWEQVNRGTLYEFIGSQSIGNDWENIQLGLPGRFVNNFPAGYAFAEYDGSFILTPKINKKRVVTRVNPATFKGSIYYYDDSTEIGGTSHSGGLNINLAKNVPPGAIACAEGGDGPLCP